VCSYLSLVSGVDTAVHNSALRIPFAPWTRVHLRFLFTNPRETLMCKR